MNQAALDFVKAHEGCELTAYQDQGGVWTIGYGTTGPDITKGVTWNPEHANFRLELDLQKSETAVSGLLNKQLSLQSMAALISFAYNLGPQALASSHLLQCVNNGDYIGAAKAFLVWDHVAALEVKGLLIRRLDEAALFLRGT